LISKGLVREEAYDTVQPIAMKALEEDKDYIDLLKADSKVSSLLTDKEIDDCFTLEYYMKNVDYIYKRVGIK
jgi:adenylosuccinate lyase